MDLSTNKRLNFGMDFILSHDCAAEDVKPDISDDRLSSKSFSDDSFRSNQASPDPLRSSQASPDFYRSRSITPDSDRSNSVSPPTFAPVMSSRNRRFSGQDSDLPLMHRDHLAYFMEGGGDRHQRLDSGSGIWSKLRDKLYTKG